MSGPQWHRVEPHARSDRLEEGLQARSADPLWILPANGRLVSLGRGCRVTGARTARRPQPSDPDVAQRRRRPGRARGGDPRGRPLEPQVEAERVIDGPARLRLAADSGAQFLRRLEAEGLGFLRARVRERCSPRHHRRGPGGSAGTMQRLRLLARRGVDGRKVAAATAAELLGPGLVGDSGSTMDRVLTAWRREYAGRFVEPVASGDTWVDERMEYRFSMAASTDEGEVVMEADEYVGGHLDWFSFDVADTAGVSHGLTACASVPGEGERRRFQLLPVPLAYSGMPATRWWELEDRAVYFGGISAGPRTSAGSSLPSSRRSTAMTGSSCPSACRPAPSTASSASMCSIPSARSITSSRPRSTTRRMSGRKVFGPGRTSSCPVIDPR